MDPNNALLHIETTAKIRMRYDDTESDICEYVIEAIYNALYDVNRKDKDITVVRTSQDGNILEIELSIYIWGEQGDKAGFLDNVILNALRRAEAMRYMGRSVVDTQINKSEIILD